MNVCITQKPSPHDRNPFNKEELSAILKFGAEELFKDSDDEDELQVGDVHLNIFIITSLQPITHLTIPHTSLQHASSLPSSHHFSGGYRRHTENG